MTRFLSLSEDVVEDMTDAFIQLLGKAKYEVHEPTKNGDAFEITLDIYPVKGALTGYEAAADAAIGELDADSSIEDVYDVAFKVMAEIMVSNMENLSYGDPQPVEITIVEQDNIYMIENEEDISLKIGEYLVDQNEMF